MNHHSLCSSQRERGRLASLGHFFTHPLSLGKRFLYQGLAQRVHSNFKNQYGSTFIESLVGLGLLATIASAFLPAVATGSKISGQVESVYTAESIARTQIEEILSLPSQGLSP